jgi:hypothetical protein
MADVEFASNSRFVDILIDIAPMNGQSGRAAGKMPADWAFGNDEHARCHVAVWTAVPSKRMARPICKGFLRSELAVCINVSGLT